MDSKKDFYVYTHAKPNGVVFYVGKGFGRRAWYFGSRRNPHHLAIINKYGAENIIVKLAPCDDEVAAFALEKELIEAYGGVKGFGGLVNQTDGGEGASGRPVSEKVLAAFNAARGLPKTTRARKAASESLKRLWVENPAMKENAARMAEKRKGVARPKHVVDALVACHKGKKLSGERLEAVRAAQKIAQELAKDWHKSEEGSRWHSEHGKNTWKNRKQHPCSCIECGKAFVSFYPSVARYCGESCKNRANRRKRLSGSSVRSDC